MKRSVAPRVACTADPAGPSSAVSFSPQVGEDYIYIGLVRSWFRLPGLPTHALHHEKVPSIAGLKIDVRVA